MQNNASCSFDGSAPKAFPTSITHTKSALGSFFTGENDAAHVSNAGQE
jgi:hypothetical protein